MSLILKPRHTEKSFKLQDEGRYSFLVNPRCNKSEVKKEVERRYQVKVAAVNTIMQKGKPIQRRTSKRLMKGYRTTHKKVIVSLQEGYFIDVYQDQDSE